MSPDIDRSLGLGDFKNFRHKFAYENVMKLHESSDLLTDWEYEFIMGIIESGKISGAEYNLSQKQFNKLETIVLDLPKRKGK